MASDRLIWVLHGPNLNTLGEREPQIYGSTTLSAINEMLTAQAKSAGVRLECHQSNHEGELINLIQGARAKGVGFFLINPAAFTHTSVALRDAVAAAAIPFIEVHLSNVHRREPFRHKSYFSDLAEAVICGLGPAGYAAALDYAITATDKRRG